MTYSKIPTVLKSAYGTTSSFTKKEHATDKVGQSFLFKETQEYKTEEEPV